MANHDEIIDMACKAGVIATRIDGLEAFAKLVEARKCKELAAKIEQMPFGDTAASFAQWVRDQA